MFQKQNYSDQELFQALKARFEAKRYEALANMRVLFSNPVGVAEHPNLVETLSSLAEELAHAEDVILTLEKNFGNK